MTRHARWQWSGGAAGAGGGGACPGGEVTRWRGGSDAPRTQKDTARVALELVWRARTLMTLESVFINDITCDWPLGTRLVGWLVVEKRGKFRGEWEKVGGVEKLREPHACIARIFLLAAAAAATAALALAINKTHTFCATETALPLPHLPAAQWSKALIYATAGLDNPSTLPSASESESESESTSESESASRHASATLTPTGN